MASTTPMIRVGHDSVKHAAAAGGRAIVAEGTLVQDPGPDATGLLGNLSRSHN